MEELPFNVVDAGVVLILIGSALLAFVRGFIKELLSILSWVGALIVVFNLFAYAQPYTRLYIELELVADAVTAATIFVLALVVFSFIGFHISKRVKSSGMNFLDRTLGFAFGLTRGAIVVSIAYLLTAWIVPPDDRPAWLQEARVLPLLAYGGQQLKRLVPEDAFPQAGEDVADEARDALESLTAEEALRRLIDPRPVETPEGAKDSDSESGYKSDEREKIDRLFETKEAQ